MAFSRIRDDVSSKQGSKKTDFTVDLVWWGLPQSGHIMVIALGVGRKREHTCKPTKQFYEIRHVSATPPGLEYKTFY